LEHSRSEGNQRLFTRVASMTTRLASTISGLQ